MIEAAPATSGARNIGRLLKPRSVAVVGASSTPGALGASVIANLERMGFAGEIHLINPKRETIGERRCLPSVADLPLGVDAAVLAIPRSAVIATMRELVERRVGAAIIFSAGFAEGGEAGRADQLELARIASDSGMVIEGPNCLGLVNYVDGIALTFVETPAIALGDRPGIGIVSQSGAMAAVVGVTLTAKSVGISYSISTGNEAASGVEDYVEHLLGTPGRTSSASSSSSSVNQAVSSRWRSAPSAPEKLSYCCIPGAAPPRATRPQPTPVPWPAITSSCAPWSSGKASC